MTSEPEKIKSVTASTFSLPFAWNDGTGCHDLSFNAEFQARIFTLLFHLRQDAPNGYMIQSFYMPLLEKKKSVHFRVMLLRFNLKYVFGIKL